VLRAKVSVFVELWNKSRQLAVQEEAVRERETRWQVLIAAMDEAAALLRDGGEDGAARALELIEEARWGA
jgi:hypothetical protein